MKPDEIFIDVTEEQYQAMRAEGMDEDALLKPGRHKFVRGLFKKMHPDFESKRTETSISIGEDELLRQGWDDHGLFKDEPDALLLFDEIERERDRHLIGSG